MRQQHGDKFNRPPSAAVNQQYKQSLQEYKGKLDSAMSTDASIRQKFDASAQGFMMLDKTRAELSQMIPKSPAAAQIDQDPTVLTIKD